MKPTLRLPVFLLGLCCSAAAVLAQDVKLNLPGTASQPAKPTEPQFTEQQLLEMYGWYLGKQAGLSELGFTPAQADVIVHGMQLAAKGGDAPYDKKAIDPALGKYMQEKQQAYVEKLKQASATESAALFAKLKQNKNVVVLPDGLCYEIIKPGTGDYPKPTQLVKVNYSGQLLNGTVFDSSEKHGGPAEFVLGQVIPGWAEGVQKINKGGKIRLYVPADLGYGDNPPGGSGIMPGATLVFDIELVDFKDAPPAPSAPADGTQK